MYLPNNISPYSLLRYIESGNNLLLQSILEKFPTLTTDVGKQLTDQDSISSYIQEKINKNVQHIQAIFDFCINDFMVNSSHIDEVDSGDDSDSDYDSDSDSDSDSDPDPDSDSDYDSSSIEERAKFLFAGPQKDSQSSHEDPLFDHTKRKRGRRRPQITKTGGTLPIKNRIKKSITIRKNKNKNKSRTKSRTPVRRITIRIKRLMKSKVTKPKTYKRRATGGKRKSKPNKTMRRYRRVRK